VDTAIDMLPVPMLFLDTEGKVIRMNQARKDFITRWNIASRKDFYFLDPRTHTPLPTWPSQRALRGETVVAQEYIFAIPAAGHEFPCLVTAVPILIDEQVVGAAILFEDISALKEEDRAKDEFMAVLAHELQTPLTSILGWSDFAQLQGSPDFLRQAMEVIHRNAVRQKALVNEVLDLSRLLHQKLILAPEPTDLWEQARQAVEDIRHQATARALTLTTESPSTVLPVYADPVRLQQCIGNLLHNSLKFTPEGGAVTLACRRQGDMAVLTVTDTGCGIAPDKLPLIFAPFYQTNQRAFTGGIGLGLAVTRSLIDLHGGHLTVNSPGEDLGSTFTIALPLYWDR